MRLKVREIAEKLGIKNASQLRARTNLGMKTVYQLWNEETELISLNTLNTLCNVLQVGPAMLFEYTPDVGAREPESTSNRKDGTARKPAVKKSNAVTRKQTAALPTKLRVEGKELI